MFDKLKEQWKKKWLSENQEKLIQEFDSELKTVQEEMLALKSSLTQSSEELKSKKKSLEEEMQSQFHQIEIKRVDNEALSLKLDSINESIRQQILLAETKANPANVWTDAFSLGFSKAWDMMMPMMTQGLSNSKKMIEDAAIQSTLTRISHGNNKKNN